MMLRPSVFVVEKWQSGPPKKLEIASEGQRLRG
jgi:hypothetical protein